MFQVIANSENLAIRFDPPLLELDPILPFVKESERLVTVYNDTHTDIEVIQIRSLPHLVEQPHLRLLCVGCH